MYYVLCILSLTQTYRHLHFLWHRHTDIYTLFDTDIQTNREIDIQTYRHTDTQWFGIQTYRHTRTYTDIQTYTDIGIQTHLTCDKVWFFFCGLGFRVYDLGFSSLNPEAHFTCDRSTPPLLLCFSFFFPVVSMNFFWIFFCFVFHTYYGMSTEDRISPATGPPLWLVRTAGQVGRCLGFRV